jgi:DNA-binding NarL/FixJ family response regulator
MSVITRYSGCPRPSVVTLTQHGQRLLRDISSYFILALSHVCRDDPVLGPGRCPFFIFGIQRCFTRESERTTTAQAHSSVKGSRRTLITAVGSGKTLMIPVIELKTYSILLADDLMLVREGLAALCRAQSQYQVVAQCSDGVTALQLIESQKPDIAVLDLNLPGLLTLEIVRKLRAAQISTRIMVLSTRKDRKTVMDALRAGANAFLLKAEPAYHLLEAFEQILDGGIYVSPSLDLDRDFSSGQRSAPEDPVEALSPREYQVFSLLVEGNRAKEIAALLDLSCKTVDTYRANLMRKLDIHHVAGLVKFAIARGLTRSYSAAAGH